MRIVVASPPKFGNHWIRCLMQEVYGLRHAANGDERGDGGRAGRKVLPDWATDGAFPDGVLFGTHSHFSRRLGKLIEQAPAHVVTIARDPYDAFVSLYHWAQERAERNMDARTDRPRALLVGKPLDHPDVLTYIADHYGPTIANAVGWMHSGRAVVVRYEGLHADPEAELRRATDALEPVPRERLLAAIEYCRAENMRQRSEKMQWHIRSGTVGDSRQKLTDAHLAVFREHHAAAIRSLGYAVR
jgi:hypothetical protein